MEITGIPRPWRWLPEQGGVSLHARTLILGILTFQEATGYEIRKLSTDGPFSFFAEISYGSIYPTLAKLEEDGLVSSRMEQTPGKPDKKIYSITDAGHAHYCEAIAKPPAMDKMKSEFLLFAMSAEYIPRHVVERAIEERIAFINHQMGMINEHVSDCAPDGTSWTADYGLHMMRADLEYLNNTKGKLMAAAGTKLEVRQAAE